MIPGKASGSYLAFAPIIHMSGAFYLFGGYSSSFSESTIGRFDITSGKWTNAGNLVTARAGHSVIYDGQFLLVVGGRPNSDSDGLSEMTEKCSISNGKVSCVSQTPQLTGYRSYPELFLVPLGFCKDLP